MTKNVECPAHLATRMVKFVLTQFDGYWADRIEIIPLFFCQSASHHVCCVYSLLPMGGFEQKPTTFKCKLTVRLTGSDFCRAKRLLETKSFQGHCYQH